MTGLALATRALRHLQVIGAVDTPSNDDAQFVLDVLNDFIDALGTHRQTMFVQTRTQYSLVSGTTSYTIGSGGTFNQARPVNRDFLISVIADRTATHPLELAIGRPISIDQYQHITDKTLAGTYPTRVYYDHDWQAGLARLYPYPVANTSTAALVLYTPTPVTSFATLQTDLTLPPGYARMLQMNLAVEIAASYEKSVPPEIARAARTSLADVKRGNVRPAESKIDPMFVGRAGRYSIESDV